MRQSKVEIDVQDCAHSKRAAERLKHVLSNSGNKSLALHVQIATMISDTSLKCTMQCIWPPIA